MAEALGSRGVWSRKQGEEDNDSVWKMKLGFQVTSDFKERPFPAFTVLEPSVKRYRQGEQSPSVCPVEGLRSAGKVPRKKHVAQGRGA